MPTCIICGREGATETSNHGNPRHRLVDGFPGKAWCQYGATIEEARLALEQERSQLERTEQTRREHEAKEEATRRAKRDAETKKDSQRRAKIASLRPRGKQLTREGLGRRKADALRWLLERTAGLDIPYGNRHDACRRGLERLNPEGYSYNSGVYTNAQLEDVLPNVRRVALALPWCTRDALLDGFECRHLRRVANSLKIRPANTVCRGHGRYSYLEHLWAAEHVPVLRDGLRRLSERVKQKQRKNELISHITNLAGDPRIQSVAHSSSTTVLKLAFDELSGIRGAYIALARAKHCPPELLRMLARKHWQVRRVVIANPNTPADLLDQVRPSLWQRIANEPTKNTKRAKGKSVASSAWAKAVADGGLE